MLSLGYRSNERVRLTLLIGICFTVLAVSYLYQSGTVFFQPHYFFVFVTGNLLTCSYLYFASEPRPEYYVPIHLFLWMFLFNTGHELFFFCAGLLFAAVSIVYATRISLRPVVTIVLVGILLCTIAAALFFEPVWLYLACTVYMIVMVLHSTRLPKQHQWSITVVSLLHVLAVAACSSALYFPYQENTIFTLPTSFILYVFIVQKRSMLQALHVWLLARSFLFLTAIIALLGYSVASYRLVNSGENAFQLYWGASFIAVGLALLMMLYTKSVLTSREVFLRQRLDEWFRQKYEDAWSQHEPHLSWSGFDSILAELVPNDGIQIHYRNEIIFSSGILRERGAPVGKWIRSDGDTALVVHETNTHMPFKPAQYYTFYALASYIEGKLRSWEEIRGLKVDLIEGGGDLGRDVKFRREVTYYLHDNILQNIIASKNIVSSIATEQAALKELAVGTLSELNASIRSQMHDIYPSTLADLSFERNIHILIDEMRGRYGYIPTPHIAYEIEEKLDEQSAYLLYRSLQELLANTCKYADADNVWIRLYSHEGWILELKEDGKLIEPEELETKIGHLGLSSLKQQARSVGGALQLIQDEQYKTFRLTLPRRAHEDTTV